MSDQQPDDANASLRVESRVPGLGKVSGFVNARGSSLVILACVIAQITILFLATIPHPGAALALIVLSGIVGYTARHWAAVGEKEMWARIFARNDLELERCVAEKNRLQTELGIKNRLSSLPPVALPLPEAAALPPVVESKSAPSKPRRKKKP